jgi:periodic tryptophan protein 2
LLEGSGLLINFYKKVALCFIQFRNLVTCLKFSPDSKLVAVAEGKRLRVFKAPGLIREVHMFDEVAEFAGIYDDITCISWSLNSQYIATGSKDLIVRVFSINSDHSLNKVHLTGARTPIVGVHFADDETVHF